MTATLNTTNLLVVVLFTLSLNPTLQSPFSTTISLNATASSASEDVVRIDRANATTPDALQYFLAANREYYRLANGENCLFNKRMTCPANGQKVCVISLKPITCAIDALQTIVLDKVLPLVGEIMSAASGGILDPVVDFAEKEIADVFTSFRSCLDALDGSEPDCKSMNTIKNCASAASSLLGLSPAKLALARLTSNLPAQAARATQAADKLGLLKIAAEDQCKSGCSTSGDCMSETLVYKPPRNCQCTEDFLVSSTGDVFGGVTPGDVFGGVTPSECAMNMRMQLYNEFQHKFDSNVIHKKYFPSVGCFVALNQTGCTAAYETVFTDSFKFVPCINQLGKPHAISNLEYETGTLSPAVVPLMLTPSPSGDGNAVSRPGLLVLLALVAVSAAQLL